MAKSKNQKLKLLYMAKYFLENTDENHSVTVADIIDYLASKDIKTLGFYRIPYLFQQE